MAVLHSVLLKYVRSQVSKFGLLLSAQRHWSLMTLTLFWGSLS